MLVARLQTLDAILGEAKVLIGTNGSFLVNVLWHLNTLSCMFQAVASV